jgi:signal transduction histidine kinase
MDQGALHLRKFDFKRAAGYPLWLAHTLGEMETTTTSEPYRLFSRIAGGAIASLGAVVLVGWAVDSPTLKSVLPGSVTMKANTAFAFLLSGTALALLDARQAAARRVVFVAAGLSVAIGLLTFSQYLTGADLGIDQLLFREAADAVGTSTPGRMAPTTALNFLLLGTALLLLRQGRPQLERVSQLISLLAGSVGLLNFTGYAYGVEALYGVASFTRMALHTALAFILLASGVLAARPQRGLMSAVTGATVGGLLIRRLLPFAIGVPVLLGWLWLSGERAGLFDHTFGAAVLALAYIFIFSTLVWRLGALLHRADLARQASEAALAARTAQLEAANRELESFSYSVSHDLRAPLRHIHGFIEILQAEHQQQLNDEGRRYLTVVGESARRLSSLIDDLLAFSRMGRAEMMRRQVELEPLVKEAISTQDAGGRPVEWRVEPLPAVVGDASMLHLVYANLLSNALKYSRRVERPVITVGAQQGVGETLFFVRDNGVGFDPRYAHKLFGVFQRLHSAEEFEGTGIGLANVRRIIARHGGRTWAEGRPGEGATFFFSLPHTERREGT